MSSAALCCCCCVGVLLVLSFLGEGGRGRIRRVLTQSQEKGLRRIGDFLVVVAAGGGGGGEEGRSCSAMVPKNVTLRKSKEFLVRLSVARFFSWALVAARHLAEGNGGK